MERCLKNFEIMMKCFNKGDGDLAIPFAVDTGPASDKASMLLRSTEQSHHDVT